MKKAVILSLFVLFSADTSFGQGIWVTLEGNRLTFMYPWLTNAVLPVGEVLAAIEARGRQTGVKLLNERSVATNPTEAVFYFHISFNSLVGAQSFGVSVAKILAGIHSYGYQAIFLNGDPVQGHARVDKNKLTHKTHV